MAQSLETASEVELLTDSQQLLQYGVVNRVPICTGAIDTAAWERWATELSAVTPSIAADQGDGEYAFYRGILDDPDFPFDEVLKGAIGQAIEKYFRVSTLEKNKDIRLDDAFCVHYNMAQSDTSGAKHMDPSDITVNLCLEKTDDALGSDVLFYGTKELGNVAGNAKFKADKDEDFQFLVLQERGYATLHWGNHPHATTKLKRGKRTNLIFTYCYTDSSKSDVASRTCYSF